MKKAWSKKNLWEKTPPLLKAGVGRALGLVPAAVWFGRAFRRNVDFVRQAQSWSAERVREHQLTKLREMLALAYHRTQYYRHGFDRAGFHPNDFRSLADLARVPTIDKRVVSENMGDLCATDPSHAGVDFGSTGGTSGTPLHFYINASRSSLEYAYLTVSWGRIGYRLGMPMAVLRGRVVKANRNGFHHEYDPLLRHHYYSNFHMSEQNMTRYLSHMAGIGSCFLHAYPSSATALSRHIRQTGMEPPQNVRGVIVESEIVYPEQRKLVEEVFGCRMFSCYGHSEKLIFASACEDSDDYHIWPTYGYFELLDEEGNPVVTPGRRGEIVGTGFMNTVMPFIRYRTGDWATYVGDRCQACGREVPILRDIRGHRVQEVLITEDGSEISWTAMNMHDDTFLRVRQFQFMQEEPGRAILRIVPAEGFAEEDTTRICRNLAAKFDGQLSFSTELVERIPLSPRGKAIYVDQRIDTSPRSAM